ncbi:ribosomal RNA small subunit methyltransferase H [Bacteroidia bacterium]|nr:ribosomal RNA small subunit methyltransferase H [Bacteroidia bacterium]
MSEVTTYHTPALLAESIEGLNIQPEGTYVDATFGGGGHSHALLNRLDVKGQLYGFDQDEDAMANALPDKRFTFVRGNFRYLSNFMDWYGVGEIDGLLADLGVSSHHFDDARRGFSFRFVGDLDMRMNKQSSLTAAKILNTYTEEALADVLYKYGELRNARAIARAIVRERAVKGFRKTADLLAVLQPFFNREKEKKQLAQVFQALRIEVNGEMDALRALLQQTTDLLKSGGRMAVITYHSLEDRMVKHYFRSGNFEGEIRKDFYGNVQSPFQVLNNKVIVPHETEIARNPRSRSAKLRIVEKK